MLPALPHAAAWAVLAVALVLEVGGTRGFACRRRPRASRSALSPVPGAQRLSNAKVSLHDQA